MKVRIKFKKYGSMKFIGHLDVMRYFQKAFRRAEVDNEYTKGFSPHQIMSFAAPLGVGLTSDSEYVDVKLLSCDAPEIMIQRMNEVMTEGFLIIGWNILKEAEPGKKAVTAMSLVASADYLLSLKDSYSLGENIHTQEEFKSSFETFLKSREIIIEKETKKSSQDVDIKPMISMNAFSPDDYKEKRTIKSDSYSCVADQYANGIKLYLGLDTGSSANLKPELVMEAFYKFSGLPYEPFAWQVHRLEVYAKDDQTGDLIPLDQVEY